MKKMMTLMAAVLAAAVTQAATITWQSGALYLPTSADDGTWLTGTANRVPGGTTSPATGYYFLLTAEQYGSATLLTDVTSALSSQADLNSGAVAFGAATLGEADYTAKPPTTTRAVNWTGQGNYAPGESGYLLAIFVLDDYLGTDWFIVNKASGTIAENGANVIVANIAADVGEWTPIPEPTSVALLAIGVAALGLRRKFRK